ncbi:hypothetical protein [Rhizobium rhizogenes]|uniref:hypothetical protein n=1 Tax=Rhizobium rhizogenes TaxID=359 RepID=UPI0015743955|nr:hypothetical protein [Rhizobium rhizogenes]NTI27662.1 hypothetical protein [Rhizobium rhizogenes]
MASKTMAIAFARGGILPASVMKTKKDVAVAPHDPVDVPIEYGQQLVTDKFAYDAAEAAAEAKAAATAATKAKAAAIDAAQKAVDEAKVKLAAATDDAAKAAAEVELKAAEDVLAAVKA